MLLPSLQREHWIAFLTNPAAIPTTAHLGLSSHLADRYQRRPSAGSILARVEAFRSEGMRHQMFTGFSPEPATIATAVETGRNHQLRFIANLIAATMTAYNRRTYEVHIVFPASAWRADARSLRAASKTGGKVRPRFCARRKIPAAALGLKEYLLNTFDCRTADKEHAPTTLRDSEILAVQHCVADHRPAFPKSFKDRGHIPSAVRAKQPWNILEESIGRLERLGDSDDFIEEAGAFAGEASASSGNAEVLAGESADEEINRLKPVALPLPHVSCAGNVWPSSGEDSACVSVSFNLPDDFTANPF